MRSSAVAIHEDDLRVFDLPLVTLATDLTNRLSIAPTKGTRLVANFTLDDLDELLGYIAAEANHCKDAKLEKQLDKLWGRLKKTMESYDDGEWQQAF